MDFEEKKLTKFSFSFDGKDYNFNIYTAIDGSGTDPREVLRTDLAKIIQTINESLEKTKTKTKAE